MLVFCDNSTNVLPQDDRILTQLLARNSLLSIFPEGPLGKDSTNSISEGVLKSPNSALQKDDNSFASTAWFSLRMMKDLMVSPRYGSGFPTVAASFTEG